MIYFKSIDYLINKEKLDNDQNNGVVNNDSTSFKRTGGDDIKIPLSSYTGASRGAVAMTSTSTSYIGTGRIGPNDGDDKIEQKEMQLSQDFSNDSPKNTYLEAQLNRDPINKELTTGVGLTRSDLLPTGPGILGGDGGHTYRPNPVKRDGGKDKGKDKNDKEDSPTIKKASASKEIDGLFDLDGSIATALKNTDKAIAENNETVTKFCRELSQKEQELAQLEAELAQAQQQLAAAQAIPCVAIPCPDNLGIR